MAEKPSRGGLLDSLADYTQLCIRHELRLLTTDRDLTAIARHCALDVFDAGGR